MSNDWKSCNNNKFIVGNVLCTDVLQTRYFKLIKFVERLSSVLRVHLWVWPKVSKDWFLCRNHCSRLSRNSHWPSGPVTSKTYWPGRNLTGPTYWPEYYLNFHVHSYTTAVSLKIHERCANPIHKWNEIIWI